MARTAGNLLKKDNVRLDGQFCLNTGKTHPTSTKNKKMVLSEPQVQIVENNTEFAVIEVTCCCGMKTKIECQYPQA